MGSNEPSRHDGRFNRAGALSSPVLLACFAIALTLITTTGWARRWLASGAAIESLLILYGDHVSRRIFPDLPLWTLLVTFNLLYAISSTSWLFYAAFAAGCYPFIGITCVIQFDPVSRSVRKRLRQVLKQLHFTRDKIALFNLPALEIDTDLDGLFVIRGISISLSSLTVVAYGIELGLKLADEIELAMCAEEVRIPLFRRVEVGHVYGSVKGGKPELFFGDLDDQGDTADDDISVLGETPLLRAATLGAEGYSRRPKLLESLSGNVLMRDSSAKAGFDSIKALSPDEDEAEKQYLAMLQEIKISSVVYEAKAKLKSKAGPEAEFLVDSKDTRAAVCAEMRNMPSIAHPPSRSVRVTTLQRLAPPHIRRFMQRMPFLYRLLLAAVSYFHAVSIKSINVAGSGQFTAHMLQQQVFKHYATDNSEIRRLERRIKHWLADANFCLQLGGIDGTGQVPLSATYDISAYLEFNDVMVYRTMPEMGTSERVVRLGGAHARVTLPSYLLPHHEHLVPDKVTDYEELQLEGDVQEADGLPNRKRAEHVLEKAQRDETSLRLSVHASLPAALDQSLLNFVAALVKATKIIEIEKEVDVANTGLDTPVNSSPTSPTLPASDDASVASATSIGSERSVNTNFRSIARNIKQGLKEGSVTGHSIKEIAKDIGTTTQRGMKKALVGSMVNDRWIAKLVGKVAAKLQQAEGDVGYSGEISIPLAPYRAVEGLGSKILP